MTTGRMSAQDIHKALSSRESAIRLHTEAMDKGLTFSRYLEVLDPSDKDSRLDAFGRQLREAGIVTRSNPRAGYWASECSAFYKDTASRALLQEFFAREWRSVSFASPAEKRAILLSSDSVINTWDRPYSDSTSVQWLNQIEPAIPLNELVAMTNPITGEDYRSVFMTYDADQLRMFRVGESAEIPMATLTSSAKAIRLRKYGRGIRSSYEQMRRLRIDRLAWWIRWMAVQSETDKVAAALDVIVNGDGNASTAATEHNLTTLDTAALAGTLTLKGWLAFRLKFESPYILTTALMQVGEALELIMLNTGSANIPLVGLNMAGVGNTLTPINATADGIRYGWTSEAPTGKIVGIDNRLALEHVMEIGADITETERMITNQTEVLVMSEVSGFAVLDPGAAKILDVAE